MSRRIYSLPDQKSEMSSFHSSSYRFMYSRSSESDYVEYAKNILQTKRKPIILKRSRSSWPAPSKTYSERNIRNTCRGSAGTAEGLHGRKYNFDGEISSRRDSFLYKSDSLRSRFQSRAASVRPSISYADNHLNEADEVMITPYAQILLTLRLVKNSFVQLFKVHEGPTFSITDQNWKNEDTSQKIESTTETLSNLEWCLNQLENIQTHRSVSELATNKFKRLLSQELIIRNSQSSNKSICDYICQTFLVDGIISEEDDLENLFIVPLDETDDHSSILQSVDDFLTKVPESTFNMWGPDLFLLERQFQGSILQTVAMSIFEFRKLFSVLKLDNLVMMNYLAIVEKNYRPSNSYHNSLHAADVLQSVHMIISMKAFQNVFSDLEVFAVLISAVIHDLDHPGVTNQFLINTNNQLAILYNDISVLENHHLAVGFSLMRKDDCNIFATFSKSQQQTLRRMMIDMVLATDMSKHMAMLADLKTMVETKQVSGQGILNLENYNDRIQILQNLIHCADLSNPAKPISLYQQWTERVMEEFFSQGDKEKELNIEVSPMCDRNGGSISSSQVSFIDFVVYPLWDVFAELVQPEADLMLDNLCQNRHYYLKLSEDLEFQSEEEKVA